MDNIIHFNPDDKYNKMVEEEGWEEDTDTVEMDMSDLSDIADGFNMIKEGLRLISNATGVSLESV